MSSRYHIRSCSLCGTWFTPTAPKTRGCSIACALVLQSTPAPNGCVEWDGPHNSWGYGLFWHFGIKKRAHVVSWELIHGAMPAGLLLRHKCDNPPCIAVEHLETGTEADNKRDMVERGRSARGERHSQSKLTEESVRLIRELRLSGMMHKDIAKIVRVSAATVSDVLRGHTWGWLK